MSEPIINQIPSPCFVCDEARLIANLELLERVQNASGVRIILALKGYSMWSTFDRVSRYLSGATASSLWEAQLARETFGKEVHAFCPTIKADEIDDYIKYVDHLSLNSLSQWNLHRDALMNSPVSAGLRVNPEHQEAEVALYDPCGPGSRLGIRAHDLEGLDLTGVDGFHVHNLCESGADATLRTLKAIEQKFGEYLPKLKWLNLGGGHLMTREGYDIEALVAGLIEFKKRFSHLDIILEPGSAVVWDAGFLTTEVVDIVDNDGLIALLDISATAHMPDVLEMPYRPRIRGAGLPNEKAYTYRMGGNSCLAGDIIEPYSFDSPLQVGDRLIFEDMLHYTMVKTSFFNGVQHPSIGILRSSGAFELVRSFDYQDFKQRLS